MSAARSVNQVKADDFDMKLYRLIRIAEASMGPSGDGPKWGALRQLLLHQARPIVRGMMHEDDRKISS